MWELNVLDEFIGKTLVSVEKSFDSIVFKFSDGSSYMMYHSQDCCESVTVDDIDGDLDDLVGSPILNAEERTFRQTTPIDCKLPEYADSYTWTFYKLETVKATVIIKWFGTSNGYYSEEVDIVKLNEE